jgi:hypothetical protein
MLARMKIRYFPQCVDGFVPFYALCHASHRSCLPYPIAVCKCSVKSLFLPKEGLKAGKILRSNDWQGKEI